VGEADREDAAGAQEPRGLAGERGHVGEPLEDVRGDGEVERRRRQPRPGHVAPDERDIDAALDGEPTGVTELCRREVHAGHSRAPLRERDAKLPAATAEFDHVAAVDVAEQAVLTVGPRAVVDGDR